MRPVTVEIQKTISLDIETAAQWFAGLTDDEQCRFIVAVCETAKAWPMSQGEQWYRVGSHIRNCECSSEDAREFIRELHNGLQHGTH